MSQSATRPPRISLAILFAAAIACRPAEANLPPAAPFHANGSVRLDGTPLAGATVTLRSTASGASATTQTTVQGAYALSLPVEPDEPLVLAVESQETLSLYRTLAAAPGGELTLDLTPARAPVLACADGSCASPDGRLRIGGLPSNVASAVGRTFDPVGEVAFFPGRFGDDRGNLLVSGGFASVELRDASGARIEKLPSAATLRLELPRSTWSVVTDIHPGTGRIEVPLYAFVPKTGEWTREGEGLLATSDGAPISEAALDAVKHGTFVGPLFAVGQVGHFSCWNIDWPIASFGCVTGTVVDGNDRPVGGAIVSAHGLSYNGSSMPRTTGPDGRFCTEAMRSELPGEDVDLNGQPGETERVQIVATRGASGGSHTVAMPSEQAECGGTCLDLGRLQLGSEWEETKPPPFAWPTTPRPAFPSSAPRYSTAASAPVLGVSPIVSPSPVPYVGGQATCAPQSGQISWPSSLTLKRLRIVAPNGLPRWAFEANGKVASPLTYGQLPEGAVQRTPSTGKPDPLAIGDLIRLEFENGGRQLLRVK